MKPTDDQAIRAAVRSHYAAVVEGSEPQKNERDCCAPSCCAGAEPSMKIGYSADELSSAPPGADLGLGCGNPQAIASLKPGEIVLDLGAGAGRALIERTIVTVLGYAPQTNFETSSLPCCHG